MDPPLLFRQYLFPDPHPNKVVSVITKFYNFDTLCNRKNASNPIVDTNTTIYIKTGSLLHTRRRWRMHFDPLYIFLNFLSFDLSKKIHQT